MTTVMKIKIAPPPPMPPADLAKAQKALEKAHISLMKHKASQPLAPIFLLGSNIMCTPDDPECPGRTAATDGLHKYYNANFFMHPALGGAEGQRAVVLHENFHVALKHLRRHRNLMKNDPGLANVAMDYVVNQCVADVNDAAGGSFAIIRDPKKLEEETGAMWLYNPKFAGWDVMQVYNYLKDHPEEQPKGSGGGGLDSHMQEAPPEQQPGESEQEFADRCRAAEKAAEELDKKIDAMIREAGVAAGMGSSKLPRALQDALVPEVAWYDAFADYLKEQAQGKDQYTYRKMRRREMSYDEPLYMPSSESEVLDRVTIMIDTSGSISERILATFTGLMQDFCDEMKPREVLWGWWDTRVASVQRFSAGQYDDLKSVLKPSGGGGTYVTCVSDYLLKHGIKSDVVVVLTDGYVEGSVSWRIDAPTVWLVTENMQWSPPVGRMIRVRS
jgi:predicted metal-dependent peptidase